MAHSIKLKFFTWLLLIFSVIFTGLNTFLYYKLKGFVLHQVDGKLKGTLHTISNLIILEDSLGQLDMELWELSHVATGEFSEKSSGHYYQIISEDGEILVKSPSLTLAGKNLPILHTAKESLTTVTGFNNELIRIAYSPIKVSSGKTLIVEIGDSLADTHMLLNSFRNIIVVVLPITFLIAGLVSLFIISRALNPVNKLSSRISKITESNLNERIEEAGMVSELIPFVRSFNTMIGHMEEAFARQRRFLSDASHELRTPTTIIKGYCDVTLRKERSREEYKTTVEKIHNTVNRMCDIINRILVISRLDNKTLQIKCETIDLQEIIMDVLKLVEPASLEKGVKINLRERSIKLEGNRESFIEVFTNILENAIKYNRPGGNVDIEMSEKDDQAIISIKDTGIGIPSDEIPRIFDRFYRVDASRGQASGSGLGLSIAKAIVEVHGGKIEVDSIVGKGSIFTVYLPKKVEGCR